MRLAEHYEPSHCQGKDPKIVYPSYNRNKILEEVMREDDIGKSEHGNQLQLEGNLGAQEKMDYPCQLIYQYGD
tara:strand:+ start:23 stop:241 length:219 start_codon:yes stop_codon:yes gene_type:complete